MRIIRHLDTDKIRLMVRGRNISKKARDYYLENCEHARYFTNTDLFVIIL